MSMNDGLQVITPRQQEVRIGVLNNRIVVMYEKPIDHIELDEYEAIQWVKVLIDKINELKLKNGDGRVIKVGN
jgi:hypothetical protein